MRYFVVSDLHSFYTPLIESLQSAGYQQDNPNHTLVVLGDLFDRGEETLEVYDFLMSIPKERLVLVYGNHEILFKELLAKDFPESHDFSNGTVKTFCSIANYSQDVFEYVYWVKLGNDNPRQCMRQCWQEIKEIVRNSGIAKLIYDDSRWVNYFEVGPFIMVHSFIPLKVKEQYSHFKNWPMYYIDSSWLGYDPDWRKATDFEWGEATWGCPWQNYLWGNFQPEEEKGKRLVCGHWHTGGRRGFYEGLNGEIGNKKRCLYYSHGIIGLDGGVQYAKDGVTLEHIQNVLVIDEKFNCYDKNRRKLTNDRSLLIHNIKKD